MKKPNRKCIFSIDVEDWFHILDLPSTPDITQWDALESRVENNFQRLLDVLSEKKVFATCFFLGWIAEKYPHLVREAKARGHEIASHGYSHRLVYQTTAQEFFQDARRSKMILEDLTGTSVSGYRASGFSVTPQTPWFFEKLMESGYVYDASVFPARRGHGGMRTRRYAPYVIKDGSKEILEFPVSVAEVLGIPVCFFGGGYLRLFPYFLIRKMAYRVLKENRPLIFYLHPREIDPDHPRLPMNLQRRFKSYVNLKTTWQKIDRILGSFPFMTFETYIKEYKASLEDDKDADPR